MQGKGTWKMYSPMERNDDEKIAYMTFALLKAQVCNFLIVCRLLVTTFPKLFSVVPSAPAVINFFSSKGKFRT